MTDQSNLETALRVAERAELQARKELAAAEVKLERLRARLAVYEKAYGLPAELDDVR